ncbi:MAG: hypothetical protein RIC35_07335 [Marinoscillum sp.]
MFFQTLFYFLGREILNTGSTVVWLIIQGARAYWKYSFWISIGTSYKLAPAITFRNTFDIMIHLNEIIATKGIFSDA